mgnify:CR=1 FL=1
MKHFLSRIGRFFLSLSKLTALSLWSGGKNGEKLNVGEHELDEESFCEICGCEIFDHGNGVITVSNYDEKGNPVRVTNFAFGGNSFDDYISEYKYDENGEVLYSETFENGRLCETFEKTGETVQKDYYYIDGSHHLSISYPGYLGDTIISQWYAYDPEGNIEYLICVSKKEDLIPFEDDKIKEVVKVAHEVLDK